MPGAQTTCAGPKIPCKRWRWPIFWSAISPLPGAFTAGAEWCCLLRLAFEQEASLFDFMAYAT
jgi:hypothetical protein